MRASQEQCVIAEKSCKKSKTSIHDEPQILSNKLNLVQNSVELTLDCLLEILQYLSVFDRIRLSRVNKRWYEASRVSLSSLKSWRIRYIGSYISFRETKTNQRIRVDYKSKSFEELLLRFGDFVVKIYISNVIDFCQVMVVLSSCRNLERVCLDSMCVDRVRFMLWKLEKLTDLKLISMYDEDEDYCLKNVLSKLRLRSFYVYMAELGVGFFNSLSTDIESLEIVYGEFINTRFAFDMLGNFKQLKSLSLVATLSKNFNYELFFDLIKKLNLKQLNISFNYDGVDDTFLIELAKYAGNLTELNISSNNVTDKGLNAVTNLSNLEILDIEDLEDVKGNVGVNLPNLRYFSCRDSPRVGSKALIKFLESSDKIEYFAAEKITEEFVKTAVKITQARKDKIPLSIDAPNTNDEKILKIVNEVDPRKRKLGLLNTDSWQRRRRNRHVCI